MLTRDRDVPTVPGASLTPFSETSGVSPSGHHRYVPDQAVWSSERNAASMRTTTTRRAAKKQGV